METNDEKPAVARASLAKGDRITIFYPPGYSVNIDPKVVGTIAFIENASPPTWIDVATQPQEHVIRLPLKQAAAEGIKLRPWTLKDGWPTGTKRVKLSKLEKKTRRAKVAKAVHRKAPAASGDDE